MNLPSNTRVARSVLHAQREALRQDQHAIEQAILEVRTYTTPSDQIQTLVKTKSIDDILVEGTVAMRAGASISFDGDMTQLAPADASGEINRTLWKLHQQAVQQATQHRERMLQALGEAAASALKALRAANG